MTDKLMTADQMMDCINIINEEISNKDDYEKPAWKGIIQFLELSNFGKNNVSIDIELQNPKGEDPLSPLALARFETIQLNVLEICHTMLKDYGEVQLCPFSEGMLNGRKCMTLKFTVK
jgi:hypothetical protein